ncbi:MAG: phage major capsid protein [Planctomycetota bacterium]
MAPRPEVAIQNFKVEKERLLTTMERQIAEAYGQDMAPSVQAEFDKAKMRVADLNHDIAKYQAHIDEMHGGPPTNATATDTGGLDEFNPSATRSRSNGNGIPARGCIGASYAKLFGTSRSNDGFSTLDDFLTPITKNLFHPGLKAALNEGSGPSGGYAVPTEYSAKYLDSILESSIVLGRCLVYPMKAETLKVAGFDSSTAAGGTLFGGIESQWIGESDTATVKNPKFRRIELRAKKLALFASASNELAADGIGFESQLSSALNGANSWFIDYALLQGTGAGQPRGVLNDPALVTVAKETLQDADTIVFENLTKMLARLHPGCFNRAVWIANPTAIPQLLSLQLNVGLGGSAIPVMRESDGGFSILSRPVVFTEKLPAVGDKGDIMLADFSQYIVGMRSEITIERSAHLRFMEDESVWRAITRLDGQGSWNAPYTPHTGDTQSWCVALAAR